MEGLTDHVGLGMLQLLRRVCLRLLESLEVEQVAFGSRPNDVENRRLLWRRDAAEDLMLSGRSMGVAAL